MLSSHALIPDLALVHGDCDSSKHFGRIFHIQLHNNGGVPGKITYAVNPPDSGCAIDAALVYRAVINQQNAKCTYRSPSDELQQVFVEWTRVSDIEGGRRARILTVRIDDGDFEAEAPRWLVDRIASELAGVVIRVHYTSLVDFGYRFGEDGVWRRAGEGSPTGYTDIQFQHRN